MSSRVLITFALATITLGATACGSDTTDPASDQPATSCLAGDTECHETGGDEDSAIDPAGSTCLVGDTDCYETGGEGIAPGEPAPGMAMCAPGVTDCQDTIVLDGARCVPEAVDCDDTVGDEVPVDEARQLAQGLLGVYESDLTADVRIARHGDEQFALTEDYVVGRITVDLDDTDGSGFRVVSATIELPDGPETFLLTPG